MPDWDSRFHVQQRGRTADKKKKLRQVTRGRPHTPGGQRPELHDDDGLDEGSLSSGGGGGGGGARGYDNDDDDGPRVTVTEGKQSSEDLIAQAAQLLGARRRLEAEIKVASDKGQYSTVVNLVKQRENLNRLLKDVFAFADGSLTGTGPGGRGDGGGDRGGRASAHGQWWLEDDEELNRERDAALPEDDDGGAYKSDEERARRARRGDGGAESKQAARDRTIRQPTLAGRRQSQSSRKGRRKLFANRPSTAPSGRAAPSPRSSKQAAIEYDRKRRLQLRKRQEERGDSLQQVQYRQVRRQQRQQQEEERGGGGGGEDGGRTQRSGSRRPSSSSASMRRTQKSATFKTHRPPPEMQKRVAAQRVRQGYTFGTLANADGLMQSAGAKAVHAPSIRKGGRPATLRHQPGPGEYNLSRKIGGGGFSMKGGTKRSEVGLRTAGGPADYNVWQKLGKGGLGFSKAGANLRLWYHDGCWCFGEAKHVKMAHTRTVCAVFVESEADHPAGLTDGWKAHLGRNRARAFGDRVKHADRFADVEFALSVASKFGGKKGRGGEGKSKSKWGAHQHRGGGGGGGNNNSRGRSASSGDDLGDEGARGGSKGRSKGPPYLVVSGFVGFFLGFNGEYIKDAASGTLNGRPVYRRVRGPAERGKEVPGPGEYELWTDIAKNGKNAVIMSRPDVKNNTDSPGPNTYNIRKNPEPANGVSFGIGGRGKWERPSSPGPGEYDPDGVWRSYKGPNGLMHTGSHQRAPVVDDGTPGPGYYLRHVTGD